MTKRLWPLLLLLASVALGQQTTNVAPDAEITFDFTAAGRSAVIDNRFLGCTTFHLTYSVTGFSAVSVEMDEAANASGVAGSWSVFGAAIGTLPTGTTLPITNTTAGQATGFKYVPFVSANLNSKTGTGDVQGKLQCWRPFGGQNSSVTNGNIVNQGNPPWTVAGTLTNNNAAPGANHVAVLSALANAASPSFTEADEVVSSVDLAGRMRTRGTLTNNNAAPGSDHSGVLSAVANAASPSFVEANEVLQSVDLTGRTRIRGTGTNNNAAPAADQLDTMSAVANAASPTYVEGNSVKPTTTLRGDLRTSIWSAGSGPIVGFNSSVGPISNAFFVLGVGALGYKWNGTNWSAAGSADPCQNDAIAKSHSFKNITTATTTALVSASGSTNIFICGIDVQLNSTTASTVLFEHGTGATCGVGTTSDTGTYSNGAIASETIHLGFGGHTYLATGASQAFCAVSTVGTGPTIVVDYTYVQQ